MKIPTLDHFMVCLSENDNPVMFFKRSQINAFRSWFNRISDFEEEMYYGKIYFKDHYEKISLERLNLICNQLYLIDIKFN